jgi:prephenate dehydrogenase
VERITVIGLGLIGGSLGLALKAAKLPNIEIVGYDTDTIAAVDARRLGAVDKTEPTLQRATADAGMVILATPIVAMRQVMEEIASGLRENCIVTDTASTKSLVTEWAGQLLPPHVSFVGGHPMAGKETAGIANADAKLFAGKAYCVVPSPNATESAVKLVAGVAHLIGAQPLFIDAHEHDRYVAAVSHLPLVLSSALFSLVRGSPAWPELAALASSGFRDLTRLASGDPELSHDICLTNREAIIHWLERMVEELSRYRELLAESQEEELFKLFTRAQLDRDTYMAAGPPTRTEVTRDVPDLGEQLTALFVGERLARRAREMGKLFSEPPSGGRTSPKVDGRAPEKRHRR